MKRKFLSLILLLLCAVALTACGSTKDPNKSNIRTNAGSKADLRISFFDGGYGETWINNLVDRFEKAKGVKVEIVKSEQGDCGVSTYIKSGYNLCDIYIGDGILWQSYVQEDGGKLEDLTDVYEAVVETSNGPQKIKDFMDPNIVGFFYSQKRLQDAVYSPWAMPWTAKPNAMAYNKDILTEIKHVSALPVNAECLGEDGKWVKPPLTYDDLIAFCEDCNAFNNNSAEKQALNDTHTYVPFGWCGSINADSIGFLITSWWAEAQGLETSNYPGEGTYYDFHNFGNTTNSNVGQTLDLGVFKQSGLKLAYNKLWELMVDKNTHKFKNTIENAYNIKLQELEQLFVANKVEVKPVLSIASSYLENEVRKNRYLDSDLDGVQDVNFEFMNVPKLNKNSEDIIYVNFSDSIIIPKAASHKELAKEFLIFMCSEEEVINFSKETQGGIRPFNVDVRNYDFEYTDFAKSLFDVYYNSKHVVEYPKNVESYAQVSHVFRYNNPSYHGSVDFLTILNFLRDPGAFETPADAIYDAVMRAVKQDQYDYWLKKFKLTDITK